MIDGGAIFIDRGTAVVALSIVKEPLLVIRQLGQIREILQGPCPLAGTIGEKNGGKIEIEIAGGFFVRLIGDQRRRLHHELHGTDAIALERHDLLSIPPASAAAVEFAGDNEAVALPVYIRLGGGIEHPPVVGMGGDGSLTEVVDLIAAAKLLQTLNAVGQVVGDEFRIVLGVGGQNREAAFVRVFPVSLVARSDRRRPPLPRLRLSRHSGEINPAKSQ